MLHVLLVWASRVTALDSNCHSGHHCHDDGSAIQASQQDFACKGGLLHNHWQLTFPIQNVKLRVKQKAVLFLKKFFGSTFKYIAACTEVVHGTLRILTVLLLQLRQTSEDLKINLCQIVTDNYIHCTWCVSANGTTHHLLGAGANQSSVNSVSTHYQVGLLFKVSKVTFSTDSSRKMAFWLSLAQILDQSSQQAILGRTALGPVSDE